MVRNGRLTLLAYLKPSPRMVVGRLVFHLGTAYFEVVPWSLDVLGKVQSEPRAVVIQMERHVKPLKMTNKMGLTGL